MSFVKIAMTKFVWKQDNILLMKGEIKGFIPIWNTQDWDKPTNINRLLGESNHKQLKINI